ESHPSRGGDQNRLGDRGGKHGVLRQMGYAGGSVEHANCVRDLAAIRARTEQRVRDEIGGDFLTNCRRRSRDASYDEAAADQQGATVMSRSLRLGYDKIAYLYDSQPYRAKSPDPELSGIIREHPTRRPISVLDVACGTGSQLIANRAAAP